MEVERDAVHAVALAGRLGAVVENVAEMTATAAAMDFGPSHKKATVSLVFDRCFERRPEARPSGSAIEFGVGSEERLAATGAVVHAGTVLLV